MERPMNKFRSSAALAAVFALTACASQTPVAPKSPAAMEKPAADMSGMAMPASDMAGMSMKMTLPPMPAIYAGYADKQGAPMFTGYSDHHHPIATANPQTQAYFDQGVRLLFAFNHAEAIRSFREAARLDPNCAMCWWGVGFALGSNINLPIQPDASAPAVAAVQMARSLEGHASPEEVAWIEALATRYSTDPKSDQHAMDEAFAEAMGKLAHDYPGDLDASVFYAESMMDTQPWDYWQTDGKTPKGHGAEIVATLEGVLKREPLHPGALHLYIHAVEASNTPERAEDAADKLEPLMPAAGHIVHMPSHIYFRVGRYADAVKVNELAAQKDEDYIAACKAQGFYPLAYYSHNIHFLWTSSEMLGRYQAADDAARRVIKASAAGAPMAANLPPVQLYLFIPVVTDIRFGKWDAALAEARPADDTKIDVAVSYYARGFAFANKHDFHDALVDRAKLAAMIDQKQFAAIDAFGVPGTQMAKVGLALLDGEIARVKGNLDTALKNFKQANDLYTALPYTEPDYWHEPVSHIYGAALLQAHKPAEAEAVYRDSLKVHRLDGWALFGLAQALDAQGKKDDAAATRKQFADAWQMADVKLASSRF
jgi:tetratricopeptide (TPR) repeat protein